MYRIELWNELGRRKERIKGKTKTRNMYCVDRFMLGRDVMSCSEELK
jgi:hypothetical protein